MKPPIRGSDYQLLNAKTFYELLKIHISDATSAYKKRKKHVNVPVARTDSGAFTGTPPLAQ